MTVAGGDLVSLNRGILVTLCWSAFTAERHTVRRARARATRQAAVGSVAHTVIADFTAVSTSFVVRHAPHVRIGPAVEPHLCQSRLTW